jgi:hypothetical protein
MASIVIVAVLIVLLTLISIGFSRLMNRAINNSTDKELGAAASYASQSGINDAASYLQKNYNPAAPSSLLTPSCSSLISGSGAPINPNLSGDSNVKYSCLTINPEPTDLVFGGQDPAPSYKSQVIKVTTDASTGSLSSLMLSWSSGNGNNSTVSGTSLYDETTWSAKQLAPLMRLTLYPIASSSTAIDNSSIQNASRTFFFYPNPGNSGQNISSFDYNSTAPSLRGIQCGNTGTNGFNMGSDSPSDYACNAIITGMPSTGFYYARITPFYDSTNFRIEGNNASGNLIKFEGIQAIIDSTAQANTSSKRLQARIDLSSLTSGSSSDNITPADDAMPEFAIDSANAICKRLDVKNLTVSVTDPYCMNQTAVTQPVLSIGLCAANGGSSCDPSSGSTVTISAGGTVTLDYSVKNSIPGSCSLNNGGRSGFGDGTGNYPTGALFANTKYTLTCTDYSDALQNTSVTVTVNPVLSFYTDNGSNSITIPYNSSTNLHWRITGQADWCWASGAWSSWVNPPSGGSAGTGPLTGTQTYHLYCGYSVTGYQTPTQNVAITVSPPPPPTVNISASPPSITKGGTSTITWNSAGVVTGCTVPSGSSWAAGSRNASGASGTGPLNGVGTYTYSIYCSGPGGNSPTQSATVTVNSPPPQKVYIDQLDITAISGTWSAHIQDNGDGTTFSSCVFSGAVNKTLGAWGQFNRSGVEGWSISGGASVTLTCYALDGASGSKTATVPTPTITINASCASGGCMHGYATPYGVATCHDGFHDYIMCISWNASQSGGTIDSCSASANDQSYSNTYPVSSGYGYSGYGSGPAPPNNWWNVTFGFQNYPGPVSTTIYIRCHSSTFGNYGYATISATWPQCSDSGQTGVWPNCQQQQPGGGSGGGHGGGPPPTQTCTHGGTVNVPPGCSGCWDGSTATSLSQCPPQPVCRTRCAVFIPGKSALADIFTWRRA